MKRTLGKFFVVIHFEKCKSVSDIPADIMRYDLTELAEISLSEFLNSNRYYELVPRHMPIQQVVMDRIKNAGILTIRKSQNIALKLSFGLDPGVFNMTVNDVVSLAQDTKLWAERQFGKENIVSVMLHSKSTSIIVTIYVVPIVTGASRSTMYKRELRRGDSKGGTCRTYMKDYARCRLCVDDLLGPKNRQEYYQSYDLEVARKYFYGSDAEAGETSFDSLADNYWRLMKLSAEENLACFYCLAKYYGRLDKFEDYINDELEKCWRLSFRREPYSNYLGKRVVELFLNDPWTRFVIEKFHVLKVRDRVFIRGRQCHKERIALTVQLGSRFFEIFFWHHLYFFGLNNQYVHSLYYCTIEGDWSPHPLDWLVHENKTEFTKY